MILEEFVEKGYDVTALVEYSAFLDKCSNKDYEGMLTQKHHILPKKMGGSNKKSNIVVLSLEDHYNAHVILSKSFKEGTFEYSSNASAAGIVYGSAKRMLKKYYGKELSSYQFWKRATLEVKISTSGANNHFYGRKHTPKSKELISINRVGKTAGKSNPMYGKTHSEESKNKISIKSSELVHSSDTKKKMSLSHAKFSETERVKFLKKQRVDRIRSFSGRGNKTDEHYEKLKVLTSELNGKKCKIGTEIFNSISLVGKRHNISYYIVKKRIESTDSKWEDWSYV